MTSSTWVSLKIVVFVVTRKPAARAALIALIGDVPEARVVADVVVDLAHAVEMDDPGQARVRLELVEHLLEAQRVRAELDVLLHLEEAGHDVLDPLVDQRLAAADRDDGRRALRAGVEALLDGKACLVRLVLADLPAADAGDVAAEGRLEHEHERVPLLALLGRDVATDLDGAAQRKLHAPPFPLTLKASRTARASAGVTGPARTRAYSCAFFEEKYIGRRASAHLVCGLRARSGPLPRRRAYGIRRRGRGRPARSAIAREKVRERQVDAAEQVALPAHASLEREHVSAGDVAYVDDVEARSWRRSRGSCRAPRRRPSGRSASACGRRPRRVRSG